MHLRSLISSFLLVACSAAAIAAEPQHSPSGQQQPSPEQMRAMMQATMQASMEAMISAIGPMTQAAIDAQLASAAKPETAERLAAFKRNLFEALTKKGFNAQEALQIVIATSPPNASPNAK